MDRREFLGGAAAATAVLAGAGPLLLPSTAWAKPPIGQDVQTFELAPSKRPTPTVSWKNGGGKSLSLADFKGKVVFVNFYTKWCPPCIRELPSIDRLQAALGGDKFEVVAISIDPGGKADARRLIKRRLRLKNLELHLDPKSEVARALGVRSMPSSFVFDQKGREVGKLEGAAEWDSEDAIKLLKYFVDNPGYADGLKRGGS